MGTIRCTRKELAAGIKVPLDERTRIIVGPDAARATLAGRAFDAGKTFPLPRALNALRDVFGFAIGLTDPTAVLVVGHTNAGTENAEELSKQRAEILAAWLVGNKQPWLDSFEDSVPEDQRWGAREDRLMLRQVRELPASDNVVRAPSPNQQKDERFDPLVVKYQELKGLAVDGIAGPITRGALIEDYFAVSRNARLSEGADASEPVRLELDVQAHGAGSAFSAKDVEAALLPEGDPYTTEDTAAPEPESDADSEQQASDEPASGGEPPEAEPVGPDERSDFFFFFSDVGVDPAPSSPDGDEYLEWHKLVGRQKDVVAGADGIAGTQLSLQLMDKTGRVVHAKRKYTISGPEELSGVTDSRGVLDYDDVAPGDYRLTLTLEFFEGGDQIVEEYTTSLLVLDGQSQPQVRLIGVVPRCTLARLRGLLFDTDKAFLLPSALGDLKDIRSIYELNSPGELLVVGHTDTTGTPDVNESLSLERAKATLAFLQDDVDTWLEFYGSGVQESRRWGAVEDDHMLAAVLALPTAPIDADFETYKAVQGIDETGVGEQTRRRLITQYMGLDGTTFDPEELQIKATVHGCGEGFPVDDAGEELDESPADEKEDAQDRRVELFFFDAEFGVQPKPPGEISRAGSTQYPTWRKLAQLVKDNTGVPKRVALQFVDQEGNDLGELEYRLVTDDGFVVRRVTTEATVRELLPPTSTSAILEIDGHEMQLTFA